MPVRKAVKKATTVVPAAPPPQVTDAQPAPKDDRPVRFPKLEIYEYSTTSAKGPMTVETIKKAMGWETEKEFQARKMVEFPTSKPEAWLFGDGIKNDITGVIQPVHCKNVLGEKVICWNNANNRPFDEAWCEDLVHTILYGQWAGPHTMKGETVNGETWRVSRYGWVLSGQHQGTAAILADEHLQKYRADYGREDADERYPAWKDQDYVFIETIVVRGMSEDPRVLMTVDYVKPRSAADVFYTSDVFKKSTPIERKELCQILATAVDVLWTRTDAKGYRTHPEMVAFLERHKRLLDCAGHIHKENSADAGRPISKLKLRAGVCAALMYLMGCSATSEDDADQYRNMEPPTEKNLDWSLWEKAEEFWTLIHSGADFSIVRRAIHQLVDSTPGNEDNQGLGGRMPERLAIVAKAWDAWKEHPDTAGALFSQEDLAPNGALHLTYLDRDAKGNQLPDGQIVLVDMADFFGIDCAEVSTTKGKKARVAVTAPPDPPAPSRDEIEQAAEAARARRAVR